MPHPFFSYFFFFNDTATTEIYTLSLHDALPIYVHTDINRWWVITEPTNLYAQDQFPNMDRSEEHTSELQSPDHLVCRLLLEKKKKRKTMHAWSNDLSFSALLAQHLISR